MFDLVRFSSVGVGNRRYLQQEALDSQSAFNYGSWVIENANTQFCGIYLTDFDKVVPRTPQCNFSRPNNPDFNEAGRCIRSNPCTVGRLAFYPPSLLEFNFNSTSLYSVPVMCLPTSDDQAECRNGQVPVFDASSGKIVCLNF